MDEEELISKLMAGINNLMEVKAEALLDADDGTGIPNVDHLPNQDVLLNIKGKTPVEKHMTVMEYHSKVPKETVHPYLEVDKWFCRHQTLVVVETKDETPNQFKERSTRFATSLNTYETIKADIMSLSDGMFYLGLVYTGTNPGGLTKASIEAQAKKWGYNQCIIVSYVGVQT